MEDGGVPRIARTRKVVMGGNLGDVLHIGERLMSISRHISEGKA